MAATRTQRLRLGAVFALALSAGVATSAGVAWATPATGVTGEVVANSTLPAPVRARFGGGGMGGMGHGGGDDPGGGTDVRTVQIAKFVTEPGGQFGWHRRSGPIRVVVPAGTLSLYSGEDARCQAEVYPAGTAFLGPGDRTHLAQNETAEPVELYAVYLLPEGGAPRIDAPAPGNCPF